MTIQEKYDKFYDCAKRAINPTKIEEIIYTLNSIEEISNIKDLIGTINEYSFDEEEYN